MHLENIIGKGGIGAILDSVSKFSIAVLGNTVSLSNIFLKLVILQ